jgi:hypothetical protein
VPLQIYSPTRTERYVERLFGSHGAFESDVGAPSTR